MDYHDINYLKAHLKASHNSYERDEDFHQQLAWDPNRTYQRGCRGVEMDIWRVSDDTHGTSSTYWMVGHTYPPGSHPFADYLGYLLSWHVNHPGHDPIFVTVDLKSEEGSVEAFPAELDTYIGEWFDRNLIFKPSDLSSDLQNLVAASLKSQWPTVGQMAGKFIFHLTGNPDWKKYYADHMTKSSLCFAGFEVDPSKKFTELTLPLNRVIVSLSLWDHWDDHDNWAFSLIPNLHKRGYLTRGYVLNDEIIWDTALNTRTNILSTDEVRENSWATVGTEPFNGPFE
jgi:hypothetical protein